VQAPVKLVAAAKPAAQAVAAAAGRRGSAMSIAMGKLGAPYRWGAAGPGAFDCSGLVFWSYRQTGMTLPRSSSAQSRVGAPVAKGALQPGDLVFFYRPVSHVAIYIGGGRVVHASTAGKPVKVSNLNDMPFATARRI
jgi:cell wall-associated NlpC family hydrolase